MFEFMDELLSWKSSLKAEVCFGYDLKTRKYLTPQLTWNTRIKRVGSEINPFWPMPYKQKGVISADIVIPEYRGEPLTLSNIFAVVEIKFQGDRINKVQFQTYSVLRVQCARAKQASKVTTSEGFKLSLFRYPEDKSPTEIKDQKVQQKTKGSVKK